MKLLSKLLVVTLAVFVMPALLSAQCTDKCAGSCLKKAAEEFAKSVPGNEMFLMSIEGLAELVDGGENNYVILDIRPPKYYAAGHIEGAMNIPLPMLVEKLNSVPTDKKIGVVCSFDTNSAFGVAVLRMHKRNAWIVEGGVNAWKGLGRELVK